MLTTRLLITDGMKAKQPANVKILEDYGMDTSVDGNNQVHVGQHVLIESDQDTLDNWFSQCDVFIIGVEGDQSAYDVYTRN